MALIKCPKCGEEISDEATYCVHCGEVFSEELFFEELDLSNDDNEQEQGHTSKIQNNIKNESNEQDRQVIAEYKNFAIEDDSVGSKILTNIANIWRVLSIASFVCSFVMLCLGFAKMPVYKEGYYSGYYSVADEYVGGDAYNFIINGIYTTSYFVLAAMFFLGAIGFILAYYSAKSEKDRNL